MEPTNILTEVMAYIHPGYSVYMLAGTPQEAMRQLLDRAKLQGIPEETARKIPLYDTGRRFRLMEITEELAANPA